MAKNGTLTAGLLALVVVLAGCGAPVADAPASMPSADEPTPTAQSVGTATNDTSGTPQQQINVTNGTLSVDPNLVFDRVQTLQGTSVDRPSIVRVYNSIDGFQNQSSGIGSGQTREFYEVAGMTAQSVNVTDDVTRQQNGYVTGLGSIVLYIGENASTVDELLLTAHEFTHYVQLQTGRQEQLAENIGGITTTDKRYVLRAILEGEAVVTTNAYLAEWGNTTATNSEMYRNVQAALPDGHIAKYENGKYVNGDAYIQSRSKTPADMTAVYENPPQTSEQILHRLSPEAEPPTPLDVTVETGDQWAAVGYDRMGEAFVRTAVESAVGGKQAATAAAGWGNDSVRFLRPADGSGDTAYAWVLRWDDATNQTEFQSVYEQSLDSRGNETGGVWQLDNSSIAARLATPTDRSSVVVFGPDALVRNVSITGDAGDVTVSTP